MLAVGSSTYVVELGSGVGFGTGSTGSDDGSMASVALTTSESTGDEDGVGSSGPPAVDVGSSGSGVVSIGSVMVSVASIANVDEPVVKETQLYFM